MRLSMIVNPPTDLHLQWAAQIGVSDIVIPYPGLDRVGLLATKRRVESFGMKLTHIERKVPHLQFVHNLPGRDAQIADFKSLLCIMADAGMEVLCYNWMPDEDWQRTSSHVRQRGGSLVTEFNIDEIGHNVTDASGQPPHHSTSSELWDNLEHFLNEVVPQAERSHIKLALHPDDPPLDDLHGQPRIMHSNVALRKAVDLVPSRANGICYCVGSLFPAGEDLLAGIRDLADNIVFFHARNVRGTASHFVETWHDNGDIDLPSVLRTLKEVGYSGTIRPDHAPSMAGESNETPGYEMLGRLYAAGYLRGLMQSS